MDSVSALKSASKPVVRAGRSKTDDLMRRKIVVHRMTVVRKTGSLSLTSLEKMTPLVGLRKVVGIADERKDWSGLGWVGMGLR